MKKKIALFCDYGLDDACATLYLFRNANKFEQIDILPIGGNMPFSVSFNNAKRLLHNVEELPNNIRLIDASEIKCPEECIPHIHGNDGMGDVIFSVKTPETATTPYSEWLKEVDDSYIFVSLGPCTLPLDALKKTGEHELLIMGGNISEPPNFMGYEFNHALDLNAFSECVKFNHFAATLDTCHNEKCDFYKIKLNGDGLFEKMVEGSVVLSRKRGEKGCYIYDLITVVFLIHPEKFSSEIKTDKDGNKINVLKYVSDETIL